MQIFAKQHKDTQSVMTCKRWKEECNRDLKLSMGELQKFLTQFQDNCDPKQRNTMNLKQFRHMMGFIGASFMGERLFCAIKRKEERISI